jgi:hypothetical protein
MLALMVFSKPPEPPGPPPEPSEPNPEEISDADAGFRLTRPGPGWKLLPRERMPNPPYSRDVRAGAAGAGDVLAQVLVIPPGNLSPDPAASEDPEVLASFHAETFRWGEQRVRDLARTDFQGQAAVRYHVSGIDAYGPKLAECTLFVRNGRVYILSVVVPKGGHTPDDPAFREFTAAFKLLD